MPDVNLTGPIAGHPLDIATQEAQQQQAQMIAMELMKQGMTPSSAVIHTGGSNPFARDVANWSGPLGNLAMGLAGKFKQDDTNAAQMATAGEYQKRLESSGGDLLNSMFPSMQPAPISDEGPNPPVLHEPDINEARAGLFKASMSQVGPVADIAKAILASQMAAQSKQTLSASDLASMIGRGNVRPSTLGGAITYGMWGPQITNPGAVGLTPNVHEGPGGVVVVTPRDQPPEKTKASDAGTVQATPQEIVPPNTPKNPTASPVVNTPEGVPKVLPGYNESPEAKNIAATNEEGTKILTEGRQKATEFQKMAPVISQMVDLVDNARLGGPTAAWVTKAQQFAKSIGVSNDDAGHIRDQQTLMKYATPAAYSMAHNLTSRPAVVEVLGSLAASAADPSVDPETAKNVYRGFMVKGLNDLEQHNQAIEKFGALPEFGKTRASVYGLNSTPEQILARALQGSRNMYNFNRDEGGVWKDMAIGKLPNTPTTPQPAQKKTIHWNDLPE